MVVVIGRKQGIRTLHNCNSCLEFVSKNKRVGRGIEKDMRIEKLIVFFIFLVFKTATICFDF